MPLYDYQCLECETIFETRHSFSGSPKPCPACGSEDLKRLITTAPTIARGILTHPGDGHRATQEQLRDKWREETPKLRKKLSDKLGSDVVDSVAPTLNMPYND